MIYRSTDKIGNHRALNHWNWETLYHFPIYMRTQIMFFFQPQEGLSEHDMTVA